MRVAIIYNKDLTGVINQFGMQNIIEKLQEFMPRVVEGEQLGMVFNMAYGIQGESRYTHLPAMLEMLGIPYVGSGPEGHSLALDKVIAKISLWSQNLSKDAFRALELRDFARVDIRMDEAENIYLLEINSMASLGRTGSYVYAANIVAAMIMPDW